LLNFEKKIVNDLKKLQMQRLKPKFTTEDSNLDKNINEIMRDVYKTLNICEKNVKIIVQTDPTTQPIEITSILCK